MITFCLIVLKEVRFRFRHDGCWLQDTTERHSVTLVATGIYMAGDDVVLTVTVHGPPQAVEAAAAEWQANKRLHKVTRIHDGPRGTRFHIAYAREGSIYPRLIEHTPVSLGPIRFADGQEHYQIIGESPDLGHIVKELGALGELEVQSIGPAEAEEPSSEAWEQLTDKQVEALLVAHRNGYYAWPRKRSASDLAGELGLSSSAFLDHLRSAESRLIDEQVTRLRRRQPERR